MVALIHRLLQWFRSVGGRLIDQSHNALCHPLEGATWRLLNRLEVQSADEIPTKMEALQYCRAASESLRYDGFLCPSKRPEEPSASAITNASIHSNLDPE